MDDETRQAEELIRTLAAATQQALWATLALKAMHELLVSRGLLSEAEIIAHTNAVIERDWNEAVRQLLPPSIAPTWEIHERAEFARLRFGPVQPGPASEGS